jgi:long-chain acyl-CoA synthetase
MSTTFRPAPWAALHRELGLDPPPPFDDRAFAEHMAENARLRPERPVLQFLDRTFSCAELEAAVARCAGALRALGVGKGVVVGLHMPNIPQYVVALGAISRLGAIGTGVSPLLAPAELAYQLEDAGVQALVSLDALAAGVLPRIAALPARLRCVIVTGAGEMLGAPAPALPAIGALQVAGWQALMAGVAPVTAQEPVAGTDTFMIQYTGGTTGRPKGAMLSIRNLMYNVQQAAAYAPWVEGADEVVFSAFPMFHVAGLSLHLNAVRYGFHTLLAPDPRDIDGICRQLKRFPPTRIAAVPTLYQMLLANPDFHEVDFSRLRIAMSGAAPLALEERRRIEGVIGEQRLSDVFGMTETGPVHVCNPPMRAKPTSVGIPVGAADTRIVDIETGTRELPFGEPGEIITTGPQVMQGYLNLPEESARALRVIDGRTWMFTGDVGYMDEEGYVYLCDRAKDMLIVGGYKVFSVEVEDKLMTLPEIAQCAVIGSPDEKRPGNDIVNLYVQLADAARGQDPESLRERILAYSRENLSPYKVPKAIHFVEQIPLTPVGKIDKKALRGR